ncbi:MAG: c-type cytochrome [Sphingobacteriales bacterium]|nr:c-type cytochrome [Sphingobacteriales bacterium]
MEEQQLRGTDRDRLSHLKANWFPLVLITIVAIVIAVNCITGHNESKSIVRRLATYTATQATDTVWRGWSKYHIPVGTADGDLVWYGHELISNTSFYLGPNGTVAQITNGMNCQNCHLDGGTLPYGNNFGKVYATYPKYRARNNGIQNIYDRINDCLERSLNGKTMDTATREMQAIYAYFKWLGEDVPKGVAKGGTSLMKLPYLDRAADPLAGKQVYTAYCQSCHGANGEGQMKSDSTGYTYPPLWGAHSYNDGAGLHRLSSFAAFVKNNMPFGTDYHNPKLSNEEAWDVAAYVNSQPRPHKDQVADWQDLAKKPVDFPFGPYADTFSERRHKYGPFKSIKNVQQ